MSCLAKNIALHKKKRQRRLLVGKLWPLRNNMASGKPVLN
jgi:hypothetical protein